MILTNQEARYRQSAIARFSIFYKYSLFLNLQERFEGLACVQFHLIAHNHGKRLFIDFDDENQIISGILNNQPISWSKGQSRIYLDSNQLRMDEQNQLMIHYRGRYSNNGYGLVRFKDRQLNQYLFTMFEPNSAHKVFPVFDQPNLKAKMKLLIIGSSTMSQIISNQEIIRQEPFNQSYLSQQFQNIYVLGSYLRSINSSSSSQQIRITIFKPTQYLPPYLFCVNVGPYRCIQLCHQLPMRIYATFNEISVLKSIKPFIQELIINGLRFYQELFNMKYPFPKYDQIFVWDFNYKAMENAGCTIISGQYLMSPNQLSSSTYQKIAITVLHQLAHSWVGNMVTLEWWHDLWIQEGLTEFLASYCLQNIRHNLQLVSFESGFVNLWLKQKRAFHQQFSPHIISLFPQTIDTASAQNNFHQSSISYTKGAIVMKQLCYIIGQQRFRQNLQDYLRDHQFSTSTVNRFLQYFADDFNKEISKSCNHSIWQWRDNNLVTTGYPQLAYQWKQYTNILYLKVTQKTSGYHTTGKKLIKMQTAIFYSPYSFITIELFVLPQQITELQLRLDSQKPVWGVILNYLNQAYCKARIDPESLKNFKASIEQVTDFYTKVCFWLEIYSLFEEDNMNLYELNDIVFNCLDYEGSDEIFSIILGVLRQCLDIAQKSKSTPTLQQQTHQLETRTFYRLLDFVNKSYGDIETKNRVLVILDHIDTFSSTPISSLNLCKLLLHQPQTYGSPKSKASQTNKLLNTQIKWKLLDHTTAFQTISKRNLHKIINETMFVDYSCITFYQNLKLEARLFGWVHDIQSIQSCLLHPHNDILGGISVKALKFVLKGYKYRIKRYMSIQGVNRFKKLKQSIIDGYIKPPYCQYCQKYLKLYIGHFSRYWKMNNNEYSQLMGLIRNKEVLQMKVRIDRLKIVIL